MVDFEHIQYIIHVYLRQNDASKVRWTLRTTSFYDFFLLELVPNHVFIFTKRFWIFWICL